MDKTYDFSGWATKYGIKCADGRTIKKGAFDDQNGKKVPMVWNHDHKSPDNVIGHAMLFKKDDGMYAQCYLNNSEKAEQARELVKHGDITALSIFANKLEPKFNPVVEHGIIREVSLVLAGANPGASIDVVLAHSDEGLEETQEAYIYNDDESVELYHSDTNEDAEDNKVKETSDESKDDNISHADNQEGDKKMEENKDKKAETKDERTLGEVFETALNKLNEDEQNAVYAMIGLAAESKDNKDANNEEDKEVKHNAFDQNSENKETVLTTEQVNEAIADAKKYGSMKDSFLAHGIEVDNLSEDSLQHGITNVGELFGEFQPVNKEPYTISRDMNWVQKVMAKVSRSPFSRLKTTVMNITADEARAKGYIKGNKKVTEVISALKRTITPQTIYKKQEMDRDDVIDITDFSVIAYLKNEMKVMLNEEIARAILIGDGRDATSADHISEDHVKSVYNDDPLYTVSRVLVQEQGEDEYAFAKKFIKDVVKSRKEYKGSGNPDLYTTEDMITNCLLIEDKNGRVIYDTVEKLKTALRVNDIIAVPVMENYVRTNDEETFDFELLGILVNLTDYKVGADKGGAVAMFDDFDIDYNKEKYLIETRMSGMLVKPYSAVKFEKKSAHTQEQSAE